MTTEEKLRVLLTTYPQGDYIIETIEISHSKFNQVFRFTREPDGVNAWIETGATVFFEGANFEPKLNSTKSDLDQNFSFTISDIENQLDDNLELIPLDDDEKISIIYRAYNASDLSGIGDGPYRLEAINVAQEKGIFTVTAGAPQLNWSKTGIIYDYDTFPMLRAL